MTSKSHLAEELRCAWEHSAEPVSCGAAPPSPGDVVVLERTARFDAEWAVLARDPKRPDEILAVAADGQPMVGSADVEIPALSLGGPLTLRCRFGGWVDEGLFIPAMRTTTLTPADIARALQRWSDVEHGHVVNSMLAEEVDDDPEYLEWVETVLQPAWQTLLDESRGAINEERPTRRPRRRLRESPAYRSFALAAVLFMTLGSALFWRQHREYQREVEHFRRENIVVNPAVLTLHKNERTLLQEPTDVHLPAGASHVVFFLPLTGPDQAPSYRAELLNAAGERFWAQDGLKEDLRELRVGLPVSLLSVGHNSLRILKLRDGEAKVMAEYPLRILYP